MRWLVLPEDTVRKLNSFSDARAWLAERLPDGVSGDFVIGDNGAKYVAKLVPLDDQAQLLTLWRSDNLSAVEIGSGSLVVIWAEPGESTIWTIGEEDRDDVLERVCKLAERLWLNEDFPQHWEYKKVENFPSVFAAGTFRLQNLRIAYSVRRLGERAVVEVGSLYYAKRSKKPIVVPKLPQSLVDAITGTVEAPTQMPLGPSTGEEPEQTSQSGPAVFVLEPPEGASFHLFSLAYSDWLADVGPLTRQQRRVITHKVHRPLRIHGPAGSGKTLVLALKALHLVRIAEKEGRTCHVLIVVNRNPLRSTLRTALEVMDAERAFLATTRDDPQHLDLDTLHGWCIRELGLEHGPQYVMSRDPEASKEAQRRILVEVTEESIPDALAMRSSLSPDLVARLEGDRDQLLRDLGYEIAIRMKGRGYRATDREKYVKGPGLMRSFVGKSENEIDRHFLFTIYRRYHERFEREGLLDTDDVVLSMAARLGAPLWAVQRREMGYDYVLVDETHLFNENERRVLPYLTRGSTDFPPLVMTFDEGQSIGGRRSVGLAEIGIHESDKEILSYVHRSCPAIFALARDLVESGPLAISEFNTQESVVKMSKRELERCQEPSLVLVEGEEAVAERALALCDDLRAHFPRVGIIVFDSLLIQMLLNSQWRTRTAFREVKERGELFAAMPQPGIYLMTPETCGGLEFDGVVIAGVDEGRVPRSMTGLSPEGRLSLEEEAYMELYTAVTRARFRLVFVGESRRGPSPLLQHALKGGLLRMMQEAKPQSTRRRRRKALEA